MEVLQRRFRSQLHQKLITLYHLPKSLPKSKLHQARLSVNFMLNLDQSHLRALTVRLRRLPLLPRLTLSLTQDSRGPETLSAL